jgi:hypothetical protein
MVQIFVRITLRGVGGQKVQLDLRPARLHPPDDLSGVVDPQVIDDQEQLSRFAGDQSTQKLMNWL